MDLHQYWRAFAWAVFRYGTIWLIMSMILSSIASLAMYKIFMKHQVPRIKEARLAWRITVCYGTAAAIIFILNGIV